jgi:hypothetical protein
MANVEDFDGFAGNSAKDLVSVAPHSGHAHVEIIRTRVRKGLIRNQVEAPPRERS